MYDISTEKLIPFLFFFFYFQLYLDNACLNTTQKFPYQLPSQECSDRYLRLVNVFLMNEITYPS